MLSGIGIVTLQWVIFYQLTNIMIKLLNWIPRIPYLGVENYILFIFSIIDKF